MFVYSNRSRPMLTIVADDVGVHDFLLTPCSVDTFRHFYPDQPEHRGCFGNLAAALAPHGIGPDRIPIAFNCFMNVPVAPDGRITVEPPLSRGRRPDRVPGRDGPADRAGGVLRLCVERGQL